MHYVVLNWPDMELLGEIETTDNDADILDTLTESDYIDGGDDYTVQSGPDDSLWIYERGKRRLILEDPDTYARESEDDDENEDDDDDDENKDEDSEVEDD